MKLRAEAFVGRNYQFSAQKTWALNGTGKPAKVVDCTFSSEGGRGLIKAAARELGLKERMPLSVKAPLIFGVVVGILSIGGVLVSLAARRLVKHTSRKVLPTHSLPGSDTAY